jgi:putative ABC transport system substrate-binding protein
MKKAFIAALVFVLAALISSPCQAEEKKYTIEVLQVTDIEVFNQSYNAFIHELKANGFVLGQNLSVNRKILAFDIEKGGTWDKVKLLFNIRSEAARIAAAKPSLALTIGTPATKYGKDKIIGAGIPLVFTAVSVPQNAGCKSLSEAGPGFTGATLYMDMNNFFKLARLAFPNMKTAGIIHTDDEVGLFQAKDAQAKAGGFGMIVVAREVGKTARIAPAAEALMKQGAEMFIVPLDTYYGLNGNQRAKDLAAVCLARKIPVVSLVMNKVPGAILYIGTDFPTIGSMSGRQAAQILKGGVRADQIPIMRMQDLKVMVDTATMKATGIQLPMQILQIAKDVK